MFLAFFPCLVEDEHFGVNPALLYNLSCAVTLQRNAFCFKLSFSPLSLHCIGEVELERPIRSLCMVMTQGAPVTLWVLQPPK